MKDEIRTCEACGKPGRIEYDSQGEGCFWLCDRRDGDHSDEYYSGIEVTKKRLGMTPSPQRGE